MVLFDCSPLCIKDIERKNKRTSKSAKRRRSYDDFNPRKTSGGRDNQLSAKSKYPKHLSQSVNKINSCYCFVSTRGFLVPLHSGGCLIFDPEAKSESPAPAVLPGTRHEESPKGKRTFGRAVARKIKKTRL